jgi:hypothetical protein
MGGEAVKAYRPGKQRVKSKAVIWGKTAAGFPQISDNSGALRERRACVRARARVA